MKTGPKCLLGLLVTVLFLVGCEKEAMEPKTEPNMSTSNQEQPSQPVQAKPEAKTDPVAVAILDAAIQARGGLDKIKAINSWKSKSKGLFMGMPYESSNVYRVGQLRMDITMPNGSTMPMVMGTDRCWMQEGPVVQPCTEQEKKSA